MQNLNPFDKFIILINIINTLTFKVSSLDNNRAVIISDDYYTRISIDDSNEYFESNVITYVKFGCFYNFNLKYDKIYNVFNYKFYRLYGEGLPDPSSSASLLKNKGPK